MTEAERVAHEWEGVERTIEVEYPDGSKRTHHLCVGCGDYEDPDFCVVVDGDHYCGWCERKAVERLLEERDALQAENERLRAVLRDFTDADPDGMRYDLGRAMRALRAWDMAEHLQAAGLEDRAAVVREEARRLTRALLEGHRA